KFFPDVSFGVKSFDDPHTPKYFVHQTNQSTQAVLTITGFFTHSSDDNGNKCSGYWGDQERRKGECSRNFKENVKKADECEQLFKSGGERICYRVFHFLHIDYDPGNKIPFPFR